MPFETRWVDPELFLEHGGVKVYHTYKDDDVGHGVHSFWFTLDDGTDEDQFDVRDLAVPNRYLLFPNIEFMCKSNPTYAGMCDEDKEAVKRQWEHWHNAGCSEAIKSVLKLAIDLGLLKKED